MTLQPLGLLLTAALVIVVRLADGVVHRRRVARRLRGLIETDWCRGRELRFGKEKLAGGLEPRRAVLR